MSGLRSRNKGKRFEREVARDLREFWPEARRGIQSRNAIDKVPDVMDVGPFSIECKHHKRAPLRSALEQAVNDALPDLIPVAICKDDRKEPIVLLRYSDFIKIARLIRHYDNEATISTEHRDEKVYEYEREET